MHRSVFTKDNNLDLERPSTSIGEVGRTFSDPGIRSSSNAAYDASSKPAPPLSTKRPPLISLSPLAAEGSSSTPSSPKAGRRFNQPVALPGDLAPLRSSVDASWAPSNPLQTSTSFRRSRLSALQQSWDPSATTPKAGSPKSLLDLPGSFGTVQQSFDSLESGGLGSSGSLLTSAQPQRKSSLLPGDLSQDSQFLALKHRGGGGNGLPGLTGRRSMTGPLRSLGRAPVVSGLDAFPDITPSGTDSSRPTTPATQDLAKRSERRRERIQTESKWGALRRAVASNQYKYEQGNVVSASLDSTQFKQIRRGLNLPKTEHDENSNSAPEYSVRGVARNSTDKRLSYSKSLQEHHNVNLAAGCIKLESCIMKVSDILSLKKLFDDIDVDGDGVVSMDEVALHRKNVRLMNHRMKTSPNEEIMTTLLACDENLHFEDVISKTWPHLTDTDVLTCMQQLPERKVVAVARKRMSEGFWKEFETAYKCWERFSESIGYIDESNFNSLVHVMLGGYEDYEGPRFHDIARNGSIHRKEFFLWWMNLYREDPINWEDIQEETLTFFEQRAQDQYH